MTQISNSQSKLIDSKESNVEDSKVLKDPLTKCNKIVITLDDKGDKVLIQKRPKEVDMAGTLRVGLFVAFVSVCFLFMMIVFVLPTPPSLLRRQQQSSHIEVVVVQMKDKEVSNPAKKSEIVKAQPKANEDGTKVLVYDGKQKYVTWPDPPPKDELASVARYVMHISEFGSLATESTHKGIEGYPFVNVFSVSDGPYNQSTGIPYFYFTPIELSVIDLKENNKASLTLTEAQSDYCNKKGFDPEDPRCAHVIFTGDMKIINSTEEKEFARNALFSRHVEMKSWPTNHAWFYAKLDIKHIYILDFFGGAEVVAIDDYFAANPFETKKKD